MSSKKEIRHLDYKKTLSGICEKEHVTAYICGAKIFGAASSIPFSFLSIYSQKKVFIAKEFFPTLVFIANGKSISRIKAILSWLAFPNL